MRATMLRFMVVSAATAWLLAVLQPAAWSSGPRYGADTAGCQLPAANDAHPLADREAWLSRYEALPPHCLKTLFMVCSEAAKVQLLDLGAAATCSIGYEALLRRGFAGDFQALMAWWRTQRAEYLFLP